MLVQNANRFQNRQPNNLSLSHLGQQYLQHFLQQIALFLLNNQLPQTINIQNLRYEIYLSLLHLSLLTLLGSWLAKSLTVTKLFVDILIFMISLWNKYLQTLRQTLPHLRPPNNTLSFLIFTVLSEHNSSTLYAIETAYNACRNQRNSPFSVTSINSIGPLNN